MIASSSSGSAGIGRALLRQKGALRTFSSSSASLRPQSSVGKAHEEAKHDDKLRHAIDLYHSTEFFFPTSATASGQESIGLKPMPSSKQQQPHWARPASSSEKTVSEGEVRPLDDQLDWLIRKELHSVMQKIGGVTFHVRNAHQALAKREQLKVNDLRTSDDELEDEQIRANQTNFVYQHRPYSHQTNGKDSSLPARDDPNAIQRYVVEAVRQESDWLRGMTSPEYPFDALDSRSARVRDALFGTVRGRKPGLDIVRDRLQDPNVQAEAKRLAEDAQRRKEEQRRSRRQKGNRI